MYENIIIGVSAVILLLYYVTTKNFNYWKKKNVPHPNPVPIFGNYSQYILLQKPFAEVSQKLCQQFRKEPYFGTYFGTKPALVVLDPDIIKTIFTKDFYHFNSRELMDHTNKETVTKNIFFQHGDMWKVVRSNMSPLFSSAKLRNMFYLIEKCAHEFENMIDHETKVSDVVAARALMIRYTMDCICSCGFGVEAGTMGKDPENNAFTLMGRTIFGSSYYRGFCNVTRQIWPTIFYGVGLRSFPKEIDDFFHNLITGVFKSRNHLPTQRHDYVDQLLNLKKNKTIVSTDSKTGSKKVEIELDEAILVAQCVVFFAAGFETSASTLSLILYELAMNQKAQKRAQDEIDAYLKKNNNKLKEDCVSELPFLEACMSETLRLYPVIPVITREVVEGYRFPSGLYLERGMRVHLPVYHLHRDSELFPDPEEYKPERFMPDAEHPIKPYTFFPFGEGPRTCIGMRLAKLQVLPGLITLLKSYSVSRAPGAPRWLRLEPTTLLLQPAGVLPVRVEKRPDWESRVYAR